MDERITLTISRSTRNSMIGKIVILLIAGCLLGYFMALDKAADFERGQHLTLEKYTEEFGQYRAKLSRGPMPMWGAIVVFSGLASTIAPPNIPVFSKRWGFWH